MLNSKEARFSNPLSALQMLYSQSVTIIHLPVPSSAGFKVGSAYERHWQKTEGQEEGRR